MAIEKYNLSLYLANKYVQTQGTIRSIAKMYNMPKSSVHRLLNEFITSAKGEDLKLALRVKILIEKNKKEKYLNKYNLQRNDFSD